MKNPRSIKIRLNIDPFSNQETKFTKAGINYTPTEKRQFMSAVSDCLRQYNGFFHGAHAVRAKFICYIKRPIACPKPLPSALWKNQITFYKPSKPDGDNYLKPLQDSLSNHVITSKKTKSGQRIVTKRGAGIIDDDSVLVDTRIIKLYCKPGESPRVIIHLKEINIIYEY